MNSDLISIFISRYVKNGTLAVVVLILACARIQDYVLKEMGGYHGDTRYLIFWVVVALVSLVFAIFQKVTEGHWDRVSKEVKNQEELLGKYGFPKDGPTLLVDTRIHLLNKLNEIAFEIKQRHVVRTKLVCAVGVGGAMMASGVAAFYVALCTSLSLWVSCALFVGGASFMVGVLLRALLAQDPRMAEIRLTANVLAARVRAFKKALEDEDVADEERLSSRPAREPGACAVKAKSEGDGHLA